MTAIQNRPARQASTVAKALICTACDVGIVIIIMMAGGLLSLLHIWHWGNDSKGRGQPNRTAHETSHFKLLKTIFFFFLLFGAH